MPRYYCDYCDTHLTHDSPSVRKQHCAGYKHKANVRQYYQQFEEQQTQSLIDQKVKEHLGQTAAALAQQQVGGAVYSHLATLQGGQYKPSPGLLQRPPLPTMRPPVLAPPSGPSPGYAPVSGAPPSYRPPVAPPPSSNGPTQYFSNNGPSQSQYSTSNGAPQMQYSSTNSSHGQPYPTNTSSTGVQSQYLSSSSSAQPQYNPTNNGGVQPQYANGPTRTPMSSAYNGPVYQR
jgi:U1 small nuclear ribonucleoprotein C